MTPTATKTKAPALDEIGAQAIDLARAAAIVDGGPDAVGEHQTVIAEDDRVVTHYFASTLPGYVGWQWAVTLARASRAKEATVDEVVLLPGEGALLAPPWVPWQERLRPGDLGVGDILPTTADDDRLMPSYAEPDELADPEVAGDLEFGRPRVLSRLGRDDAADRWYSGAPG
ncbi:MAG: hypothetical protein QOC92_4335, partial [Acidimicrobiaceae bacterium]